MTQMEIVMKFMLHKLVKLFVSGKQLIQEGNKMNSFFGF